MFNYPRLTVLVEEPAFASYGFGGRTGLRIVWFWWKSRPSHRMVLVEEPAFRPALRREITRALAPVESDHRA
jgi:hypothetical protein